MTERRTIEIDIPATAEEREAKRAALAAGRDRPRLCEDCDIYWADPPSRLCPGCQAYREHQQ